MKLIEDKKSKSKSFYLKDSYKKLSNEACSFLINFSKNNNTCDVRLCIHESPKSEQHNMLLIQTKKNYYVPHKHLKTGDTILVLRGTLACFLFDAQGRVTYKCVLRKNEIFKTPTNVFHTFLPLTSQVLMYETKKGPFVRSSNHTIFPKWCPSKDDSKKVIDDYKKKLFNKVKDL